MQYIDFVDTFCRWIPAGGDEHLSLREKSNFDCIFWENGCSVYNSRPLQCRTFPFWFSNLASEEAWKEAAALCPGMDQGRINSRDYIETCLTDRRRDPVISRKTQSRGSFK
ncbi:hypothetical protein AGMMS49928_24290 [Spirochaetia bacterium]|nr:hypothetical protein AGMMS49928_24290 [Spirochaetia bacterium]